MEIDASTASRLGFPRPQYTAVEFERRWLCDDFPRDHILQTEAITDLYLPGTQLRLREARPLGGGPPLLRLSRKADIDAYSRLITSIYLPEEEFAALARALTGDAVSKVRHRLRPLSGSIATSVDEFKGLLGGLLLLEAEFEDRENMLAFQMPDFARMEVTQDVRFTGASLARNGLPDGLP